MLPCICIDVCLCLAGVSEVLSRGAAQSDVAGGDRAGGVDAGLHQRLAGSSAVPKRERETQQWSDYHTVRFLHPRLITK